MEDLIQSNLERIKERIESAAGRAGRKADEIRLMGACKMQPAEKIMAAYEGGLKLFGENRVAEGAEKFESLPQDIELHLIGHLQRNKAKIAAAAYACIQSIDKISTVEALCKYRDPSFPPLKIYLEINTSGEESKQGVRDESELYRLIDDILSLQKVAIHGLMTIGPFTRDEHPIRASFSRLRKFYESVERKYPEVTLEELSMGMSSDYELAVEEGSTLVRVGSALFGERNYG
jgi:pyridoxal phosphate enzyme (YggS family)